MRNKITIIGAGNVGATTAHWLAEQELGDIVLVDIPQTEGMPAGKALDMTQAGPMVGYDTHIMGVTDYDETVDSDIVIITAGIPRKPGMSREDLVGTNQKIITDVVTKIKATSPDAILIVVTNPLDTMALVAKQASGEWLVRAPNLKPLARELSREKQQFERVIHRHVARTDPKIQRIDGMVNE